MLTFFIFDINNKNIMKLDFKDLKIALEWLERNEVKAMLKQLEGSITKKDNIPR